MRRSVQIAWLLLVLGATCAAGVQAEDRPATVVAGWEGEAYREGGAEVAYHDATPGNSGPGRAGDVDLGLCADGDGCVSIDQWTRGDWVSYDTPPLDAGTYVVNIRLAVPARLAALRVSFSGGGLEGFLRVPLVAWSTGGAESWTDVLTRPVRLPAGQLALYLVQAGTLPVRVNRLHLLKLEEPSAQPTAVPPTAVPSPAPQPTPTSIPPAPSGAVPRFAWFSKPPTDGTPAETLARHADIIVLSHHDETFRDRLLELGVSRERIYQYVLANEIQDPGSCEQAPWGNNAAWHTGDFCRIRDNHPNWFLRDTDGRAISSNWGGYRWYMMDPGNAGWQTFMIERLGEAADRHGWRGVFLDNLDGSTDRGREPKSGYPTDEAYQAAIERYLERIRAEHIDIRGLKLLANQTARPSDDVWHRYLRLLDGAMEESCILDWRAEGRVRYLSPERWEQQLKLIESTQSAGKTIICVIQGIHGDAKVQRFAYASYLLAAHGGALFRYSNSNNYSRFWGDDSYSLNLGAPLGARYRDGRVWRRDFAHYSISVDPHSHTASIAKRRQ